MIPGTVLSPLWACVCATPVAFILPIPHLADNFVYWASWGPMGLAIWEPIRRWSIKILCYL